MTSWLTLIAGLRAIALHLPPDIVENATDPRFGVAIGFPRLNWVFRGFYGDFYQAPPLLTATGPLLGLATSQGLTFAPLHGERDRGIPVRRDDSVSRLGAGRRYLSNRRARIGWTITISENRISSGRSPGITRLIQGWELTLRSPRLWHRGQFHLAYANQIAQATSPITGGLICPSHVTARDIRPVDHDQRNTLNVGFNATLPWQTYASTNVYYGSGFTNGIAGRAISRELSARTHHVRSFARENFCREILRFLNRR